ncbi:MAG TPA: hypothetical protein PK367_03365 [Candidatus Paceibacterota bacterium]|nr:hypothetical protein [Candidatus Paceibacterota bacterium]
MTGEINKNKFVWQYWVLATIFLLGIFMLTLRPIADYDTGYHLKTGEYVVKNLEVPKQDVFTYTAPNAQWVTHYWLSDVVFYFVYVVFGGKGIIGFVSLLAVISYLIVLATFWKKFGHSLVILLLLPIYAYLMTQYWVPRPHLFSLLFSVLIIYLLERWRETNKISYLYWLPAIFIVWANMHAGVVFGMVILGLYAGGVLVKKRGEIKSIIGPIGIFVTSCLVTLLNPNGYKLLTYGSTIAPVVKQYNILEWKPLLYYWDRIDAKAIIILMIITLVFVWWAQLRRKNNFFDINWISLGLVTGGVIMAFYSTRHAGFFSLLVLPVVGFELECFLREKQINIEKIRYTIPLVVAIGIVIILGPLLRLNKMDVINHNLLPVNSVHFFKDMGISGPIFHHQHFGGYLIWQLWPQEKVFIDGRSEIAAGAPSEDYMSMMYLGNNFKYLFNEKYRINSILLSYPDIANKQGEKIVTAYTKELGFVPVFFDDAAILLVRPNKNNETLTKEYGYRYIHPLINIQNIKKEDLKEAYQEALRSYSISPDSLVAKFFVMGIKSELDNFLKTSE